MYGFETTILLPLRANVAIDSGTPLYPDDVRQALARLPAPRVLVTSPVHLRALADGVGALPALAAVISATAPLDAALAQRIEVQGATTVREIYGCTEVGTVASREPVREAAWTPFAGVSLEPVVDRGAEAGAARLTAPGEPAMLLNDLIALEPDRRFRLLGRRQDVVKVGGKRASLAGLTAALLAVDGVVDGAVVMPDAGEAGEEPRPCALVVAPGLDPRTILAALRRHVEPAFVPRRVVMVAALPRDPLGKLPKARVQALLDGAAEPEAVARIDIPADHPALAGHFPGRPIVPGVVLLEEIARAARAAFGLGAPRALPSAKFQRPLDGAAAVVLRLRLRAGGRVAYEARLDGVLVAAGELVFDAAAPS
jgi:acyl-coenzyme A synthetase/AMP-(fatty) acid ligase